MSDREVDPYISVNLLAVGVVHLNLIKNEMPEYRRRIMSLKMGEGDSICSSQVAQQPKPFNSDQKKKKKEKKKRKKPSKI